METLIVILIPTILSGLAFVSYKHPLIARKLIIAIFLSSSVIFMFLSIFLNGKTNGLNESRKATNISIYKYDRQLWDSNTINLSQTNKDSIKNSYILYKRTDSLKSEIKNNENILKDSIKSKITLISENIDVIQSKSTMYFGLTTVVLLIFLYLSYTFDKLWKQEKKENKN